MVSQREDRCCTSSRRAAAVFSGRAAPVGKSNPAGKVLMGNAIKARPGPIRELNLKMGTATVQGKVFAFECGRPGAPACGG